MSASTRHRGRILLPPRRILLGTVTAVASLALLALACGPVRAEDEPPNFCVACHSALPEALGAPVQGMAQDVHTARNISCADCHGGDPTEMGMAAMDPARGFRGKLTHAQIPEVCAHCHSDPAYMRRFNPSLPTNQRERYLTSVHGQRLVQGDQKVATCISCHGVHGILPGSNAKSPVHPTNIPSTCGHCHSDSKYMAGYDIPTNQEKDYLTSVHAELLLKKRDLSAPTCTTCHDNHGASPPGLTSIADVCGQCHVNNAAYFVASPHKQAFDRIGLPECVTCHGNHAVHRTSDSMLGVGDGALCIRCHTEGTKGYVAAKQMRGLIDHLEEEMHTATAALDRAQALGMEVSDAAYQFHEVDTTLIKARTEVHRFSVDDLKKVVSPGVELAEKTQKIAAAAIAQAQARRRNLLVPIGLIVLLMVLLALKLRRLERE